MYCAVTIVRTIGKLSFVKPIAIFRTSSACHIFVQAYNDADISASEKVSLLKTPDPSRPWEMFTVQSN